MQLKDAADEVLHETNNEDGVALVRLMMYKVSRLQGRSAIRMIPFSCIVQAIEKYVLRPREAAARY